MPFETYVHQEVALSTSSENWVPRIRSTGSLHHFEPDTKRFVKRLSSGLGAGSGFIPAKERNRSAVRPRAQQRD
jgi:hypothetical protein